MTVLGDRLFPCRCCGKVYKHRTSLCKHQRYECGKLPQFACPHCPYRAKQKGTMKSHEPLWQTKTARRCTRVTDAARFTHTNAPFSFTLATSIPVKLTKDGKQTFSCDKCGKIYRHRRSLWLHDKYECGKPPQFICPYCPYLAKRKSHMKTHLALKHSEVSDSWNDCGKTYTHKRSLWLHGKYECGKPPQFLCPFCPYKAKLKGNLKTHVLIKHPAAANAWDP
ncbi:hypothetical protein J6590_014773 [Homalodisca vitripennis]|nr:hypothetical protein J6590_014773 [Homalodisca vitripennis]